MLAKFLNKSKPINFIGLLAFFFLNYLIVNFVGRESITTDLTFFAIELSKFLLLLMIFFFLNFIVGKNKLTFDNSFGFYSFVLLTLCLLPYLAEIDTLIILSIQILYFRKVYSLHSSKQLLQKLFDAGFWLGLLLLFDANGVFYFGLLFFAVLLHQKITIQTLLAPIVGVLSPLIIYFAYLFWFERTAEFVSLFSVSFSGADGLFSNEKSYLFFSVLLAITGVCILLKSIKVLPISNTFRKSWTLMIVHFALSISIVLMYSNEAMDPLIHLIFPSTLILANGIELIKKSIFKEIAIYVLLVASLYFLYGL